MALRVLPPPPGVDVPRCPHGPALLFERSSGSSTTRLFYACSACRERRSCPLMVPADATGRPLTASRRQRDLSNASDADALRAALLRHSRLLAVRGAKDLAFCRTCSCLVTSSHANLLEHDVCRQTNEIRRWRRQPTRLLAPRTANAQNAQFLFDGAALTLLLGAARRAGASGLLCLGCPRLHEAALCVRRQRGTSWPDSVLLDLDERFEAFYGPRGFARYNMFNHHFPGGRSPLRRLTRGAGGKVLLVCDPPYGGLLEPLSRSLEQLWAEIGAERLAGTVLVMPYFMEKKILEFLPQLKVCDFPISYENHRKFAADSSPARLFSDLPPSVLRPTKEMAAKFRFCNRCNRHSALSNLHCDLCDACPTRHGATYRHCAACGRCVKPTWRHCERCDFCVQPLSHRCAVEGDRGS